MKLIYKKTIKISLGEHGEFVYVWKGNSAKELLEFSVSLRTEMEGKWYTIRRHCWTQHQNRFHTHVRVGIGRKKLKVIYPPPMKGGIKKALNWAKKDMMNNWYLYLKNFEKIVKNS